MNGEKYPEEGSQKNLKPRTYERSEDYAPPSGGECLTAYLLYNGPASYPARLG